MITTYEYINLLKEVKKSYLFYNKFITELDDNGLYNLDVVRKTHLKIKKIYEDRRMFPNWDLDENPGKQSSIEKMNLYVTELSEYCHLIGVTYRLHDLSEYKFNQKRCISYFSSTANITNIIDI